ETSRFQTREIQESVHQLEQTESVVVSQPKPISLTWTEGLDSIGQSILDRSQHERQRGPELMTDVAEEHRLGAVYFRERFGSLLFRLVRARAGDDVRHLIRRCAKECVVALRSEEHTSELQSRFDLVCRLLLEKKK